MSIVQQPLIFGAVFTNKKLVQKIVEFLNIFPQGTDCGACYFVSESFNSEYKFMLLLHLVAEINSHFTQDLYNQTLKDII